MMPRVLIIRGVPLFVAMLCVSIPGFAGSAFAQSSAAAAAVQPAAGLMARQTQRVQMLQAISPSVVCVMSADGQGGGSGVLISADGYAISNYHVTSGSGHFLKCGLNNGKLYDAVIVGIDPTGDIAMIKLLGRDDFPYATPGDSDAVRVGDEVVALGNPFLLASDFTPTVTYGIVSGVNRYQYPANTFLEYTDCIQIDASINPGNSGGPLFDIDGKWIGINGRASFEKRGRVNAGAAYAISVRQVQLFVDHLKAGMIVDHGIADFTVETSGDGRAMVSQVSEISEAWRRGLRPQHELVSFAGRPVASANEFQNVLGIFPEGTRLPLTWRDQSGVHSATIRLRPLHAFRKAPELPGERKSGPPNPEEPAPETPDAAKPGTPEVPAGLKALFEERDGYANYFFCRQQTQRLLSPLRLQLGETSPISRTWVLSVAEESAAGDVPGELIIGEAGAGFVMRDKNYYQPADKVSTENESTEYPGLLSAAVQWHRLFEKLEKGFEDVSAGGRSRHLPTGQIGSILLTKSGSRTARWYFDGPDPLPFAVDLDQGEGNDEARVLFSDWNGQAGLSYPGRIGVVDPATEQIRWLKVTGHSIRETSLKAAAKNRRIDGQLILTSVPAAIETLTKPDEVLPENDRGPQLQANRQVIAARQSAVVKLFGAGVGNLDSYGSAVLISEDGHMLTIWNHLINVGYLTAMTEDGRRYTARVVGTSRDYDLAVLQLQDGDGRRFPFVDLRESAEALPGDSVLGFSNMFHVATGREPVSVVHGVVATKSPLEAGNGRWNLPVKSPVLIVDAVTNNSGAAGGLLTRTDGTPIGLIGREIRNRGSNTWVNYAVPLVTLAPVADAILQGRRVESESPDQQSTPLMADRKITSTFGLTLLPDVVERTPAFIDGIVVGSVAAEAGFKRGDLIVLLDDDTITSVTDFRRQIAQRRSGQRIAVTVSRDQQLVAIELRVP